MLAETIRNEPGRGANVPGKSKAEADESGAVLTANRAFYRAFRNRDTEAMERLWAEAAGLVCIHPGWEALTKRSEILESWRGILESPDSPPISCEEASVRFAGDAAIVLCTEMIGGRALVATNVFVREGGAWRLVLHQATPTARTLAPRKAEAPKTLH
jgi:ketosteroid isomerase-like protein